MDRFHIVVANCERVSSFVDNFHLIQNFDRERDRVYIFDCEVSLTQKVYGFATWRSRKTSDPDSPSRLNQKSQVDIADSLTASGLTWGVNLFFVRRRNWGENCGAHLDYYRSLIDGTIPTPEYCFIMQEHYLDQKRYVNLDTIPEGTDYDLDRIEERFRADPNVGCVFSTRLGIRISTSNPDTSGRFSGGDSDELYPGAVRRFLFVDGSNFAARPQLYVDYFLRRPTELTSGDGSHGFVLAWEARLGKILYDQNITWVDLYRDLEYRTIADVDRIERARGQKVSMLWYDYRFVSFLYNRNERSYSPKPIRPLLRYSFKQYLPNLILHSRRTRLRFVQPHSEVYELAK